MQIAIRFHRVNITAMTFLYPFSQPWSDYKELNVQNQLLRFHFNFYTLFMLVFCFAYKLKPAHIIMKAVANGSCGKQLVSNVFFL